MASRRTKLQGQPPMRGEYFELGILGEGAFAIVYKAVHKDGGDIRAIKALKKHECNDKDKAKQEIIVLKTLDHPNIMKLHDVLSDEGESTYELVTEYCAGGSLEEFLKEQGTLSEPTIIYFTQQICLALEYLAERGILHRDLKPDNILLSEKSDAATLKLADFGLARHLPEHQLAETIVGTPLFWAPELLNKATYDRKAEIWSLGVMVFRLFTGKYPFKAKSLTALREMAAASPEYPRDMPASCRKLCESAIQPVDKRATLTDILALDVLDFENFKAASQPDVDLDPGEDAYKQIAELEGEKAKIASARDDADALCALLSEEKNKLTQLLREADDEREALRRERDGLREGRAEECGDVEQLKMEIKQLKKEAEQQKCDADQQKKEAELHKKQQEEDWAGERVKLEHAVDVETAAVCRLTSEVQALKKEAQQAVELEAATLEQAVDVATAALKKEVLELREAVNLQAVYKESLGLEVVQLQETMRRESVELAQKCDGLKEELGRRDLELQRMKEELGRRDLELQRMRCCPHCQVRQKAGVRRAGKAEEEDEEGGRSREQPSVRGATAGEDTAEQFDHQEDAWSEALEREHRDEQPPESTFLSPRATVDSLVAFTPRGSCYQADVQEEKSPVFLAMDVKIVLLAKYPSAQRFVLRILLVEHVQAAAEGNLYDVPAGHDYKVAYAELC